MIKFLAVAALLVSQSKAAGRMSDPTQLSHERTEFRFTVNLPYEETFPLFGAWKEQEWSLDWKPEFLYPSPPADIEGAVFRVTHGFHTSIWILTRFDRIAGQVQYAILRNELLTTRLNIDVKSAGSDKTDVTVAYEWTALDPSGNEHVTAMTERFRNAGAEWGQEINSYAEKLKTRGDK